MILFSRVLQNCGYKCKVLDNFDGVCEVGLKYVHNDTCYPATIHSSYERHYSHIQEKLIKVLKDIKNTCYVDDAYLAISGSAGMGLANDLGIEFIQEVYATRVAVNKYIPGTDCVIELGGEDAKILFLSDGLEVRMNGSCAGGTGAFIDQMSTLLNVSIDDLNAVAKEHEKVYNIASRCGVFAKTDIQPLLNQGAKKQDIAASIFNVINAKMFIGVDFFFIYIKSHAIPPIV